VALHYYILMNDDSVQGRTFVKMTTNLRVALKFPAFFYEIFLFGHAAREVRHKGSPLA
jgi:hypothetical protein